MINYPDTFSEASPAGFDGVFEWDFLKPAWAGTTISPMDIDAMVERGGRFIVFETKNTGVPIPRGQVRTLEALVNLGVFRVIVLRGKRAHDISGWEVWHLGKDELIKKDAHEGSSDQLAQYCRRWFEIASANEPPPSLGRLITENMALSAHLLELGRRPPNAPICAKCGLLLNGDGFTRNGQYYHRSECVTFDKIA